MAIAVIVDIPSREAYETVNEKMFGSKRPTEPIEGNIIHTAGDGPNGFRVVDVWESQEAFDTFFNNRVAPAMQAAGLQMEGPPPQIVDLIHVFVNEETAARV
jgi:quinol monooxygenase YgiN